MTIGILLQLFVWVWQPTNSTSMEMFDNGLVKRTTPIIIEELIQESLDLTITKDSTKADIWVKPLFIYYHRPNTESSIFIFKGLTEEVGLEMRVIFQHKNYNMIQSVGCTEFLIKEAKSNFFSIEEGPDDFADMVIFNLIKKTLNSCFEKVNYLLL